MWTLYILAIFINGSNPVPAMDSSTISGFKSEAACQEAMSKINLQIMTMGLRKTMTCVKVD
jgi:hypothetical protein